MLPKEFERILDKNERYMKMLEYYDRTGRFPLDKIRRSFTLKEMNVTKLKKMSKETGRSMSDILDELIENNGNVGKKDKRKR